MTHDQYLEAHHELTNTALTEVALLHSLSKFDEASSLVTETRAQCDALWEQRRATAEREVAP